MYTEVQQEIFKDMRIYAYYALKKKKKREREKFIVNVTIDYKDTGRNIKLNMNCLK